MHLCTDDGTMQFSALLFDQTLATTIFFSFIPFISILMMGRHIMAQTNRFLMFYYTRHFQSSLSQKVTLLILPSGETSQSGKICYLLDLLEQIRMRLFFRFQNTVHRGHFRKWNDPLGLPAPSLQQYVVFKYPFCYYVSPRLLLFFPDKHVNKSCQEKASFLLFKPPSFPLHYYKL